MLQRRLELPTDLAVSRQTAEVRRTDVHGRTLTETLTFGVTESLTHRGRGEVCRPRLSTVRLTIADNAGKRRMLC
ncbi:hypothetical protein GCM10022262_12410 [Georgenia daeguensis]|uniref:Uncharacterized protein n=1 Tax=Georgenia daeguensis TaxID=908355 RepID=A0ABP8ESQ4_9MICO